MRHTIIFAVVLVLTFAGSSFSYNTQKTSFPDYIQYGYLPGTNGDFSYTPNNFDNSNKSEKNVVNENQIGNVNQNPSEFDNNIITEDTNEELFDGSAEAMGLGIF